MPYIIDGNNLLGSWGGPAVPGDGRVEVLRRVAAFCRARGARVTLVFDGAPFRPEVGAQEMGRVSLRFPERGSDADVREQLKPKNEHVHQCHQTEVLFDQQPGQDQVRDQPNDVSAAKSQNRPNGTGRCSS